jgi:peptidoglycan/xylan/chitin deacetylase (PgdA/CDA1 family)
MAQKKINKHSGIVKLIVVIVVLVIVMVGATLLYHRHVQLNTYTNLQSTISQIEDLQKANGLSVIDTAKLNQDNAKAKQQIDDFDLVSSGKSLANLKTDVTSDKSTLQEAIIDLHNQEAAQAALASQRAAAISGSKEATKQSGAGNIVLPIIMYHKPPADFDAQMVALKNKGYTTVHMQDVANYFEGKGKLPAKPAVVTFDDGFEVQMSAMPTLQRLGQKATLYLIVGGEMSHYCIGLLRTNTTCGDAYLSVIEVKQMLSTGLIEIGDHTIDHPNMASLTPAVQQYEITAAKDFLSQTFNVPINTFAYPYGSYNGTTVTLLAQDGFTTAVTTQPGIIQPANNPLLLHRTRTTYDLP